MLEPSSVRILALAQVSLDFFHVGLHPKPNYAAPSSPQQIDANLLAVKGVLH
jgi:hypothetical protein